VAAETCIDFEIPHTSSKEILAWFFGGIAFVTFIYEMINLSDPEGSRMAVSVYPVVPVQACFIVCRSISFTPIVFPGRPSRVLTERNCLSTTLQLRGEETQAQLPQVTMLMTTRTNEEMEIIRSCVCVRLALATPVGVLCRTFVHKRNK